MSQLWLRRVVTAVLHTRLYCMFPGRHYMRLCVPLEDDAPRRLREVERGRHHCLPEIQKHPRSHAVRRLRPAAITLRTIELPVTTQLLTPEEVPQS